MEEAKAQENTQGPEEHKYNLRSKGKQPTRPSTPPNIIPSNNKFYPDIKQCDIWENYLSLEKVAASLHKAIYATSVTSSDGSSLSPANRRAGASMNEQDSKPTTQTAEEQSFVELANNPDAKFTPKMAAFVRARMAYDSSVDAKDGWISYDEGEVFKISSIAEDVLAVWNDRQRPACERTECVCTLVSVDDGNSVKGLARMWHFEPLPKESQNVS